MRKGAVIVAMLLVASWAVPQSRARLKAMPVLADAAGLPFPRPFAPTVTVTALELAPGVVGDLYRPGDDDPLIVFVPGAAPKGRRDPRVLEAASALAKTGRRVFVPELELYDRTFRRSDIDHLAIAIEELARDEPIGVLGFSYGGSFALVAAADPRAAGAVSYIATFGSYYDLRNVIQGVTTGATILDGEEVAFATVPEAREILTSATLRLARDTYADELEDAIEDRDPDELPEEARALYDVLTNRDPARTDRLFSEVPERLRRVLEEFSPSRSIEELNVPVFVLQSKKDAATPWTEATRLARAAPRSRLVMLDHFSHVDPPGIGGWLADGPRAWWFLSWVVEAQE